MKSSFHKSSNYEDIRTVDFAVMCHEVYCSGPISGKFTDIIGTTGIEVITGVYRGGKIELLEAFKTSFELPVLWAPYSVLADFVCLFSGI